MKNNTFSKYASKIEPLYIPIPKFKFYHGASTEEMVDDKFIGRDKIIDRLKSWLTSSTTKTGVYLITGFRGMGKSSFVGKVLNQITVQIPKWQNKLLNIVYFFSFALLGVSIIYCFLNRSIKIIPLILIVTLVIHYVLIRYLIKNVRGENNIEDYIEKSKRIPIKLNLGHEILNERDILSLISYTIEKKYRNYLKNTINNWKYIYTKWLIITLIASLFFTIFKDILLFSLQAEVLWSDSILANLLRYCNDILVNIKVMYELVFYIFMCSIIFLITYKIVEHIYLKLNPDSSKSILKKLHELNFRIAASTDEDSGSNGSYSSNLFKVAIKKSRNRHYPLANVREIEQELSWILDEISNTNNAPDFIVVFDELDKIDPVTNYEENDKNDTIPAFENYGSGFIGGATSRKRKQNMLRLLANMKYFISTAKAKFIFIAGRELYDAYLADTSDREFAIGSIFNNIIYVDSFLSSDPAPKDIVMMTERYICKQLFPNDEIDEIAKELRNEFKGNEYYTLKVYNKYLERTDEKNKERTDNVHRRKYIILTLYHFAVYLSHVSNGAPKKITNYFEKYVEPKKKDTKYYPNIGSNYYLAFNYRTQQKIGFIHYIALPVVNAILNNASLYGDKLLISGCFLTNHIYKYHNSGFSWRNLENIPELLDPNKSPETRKFIEVIISYLRRSHLSTTINSLYHFKFPLRISEEISLMSRFSEEVSALLNFTLDDSLSLKRHYTNLLEYYSKLQKPKRNELHHVIAGIHHILGDLHALDEEYNEAIFEYQVCISILLKEYENMDKSRNNDPHYSVHILNIVRIMLKLGLSYEKRKTNISAYTTYNELIALLINFKIINQSDRNQKDLEYKQKNSNVRDQSESYKQLLSKESTLNSQLYLFENISLVYQALLARLFVLEKKGLSGIAKENIDILESDFFLLQRSVYYKEKYMIEADFFRKLADILYYKNGLINTGSNTLYMSLYYYDYDMEEDFREYFSEHRNDNRDDIIEIKEKPFFNISKDTYLTEINENISNLLEVKREKLKNKGIINNKTYVIVHKNPINSKKIKFNFEELHSKLNIGYAECCLWEIYFDDTFHESFIHNDYVTFILGEENQKKWKNDDKIPYSREIQYPNKKAFITTHSINLKQSCPYEEISWIELDNEIDELVSNNINYYTWKVKRSLPQEITKYIDDGSYITIIPNDIEKFEAIISDIEPNYKSFLAFKGESLDKIYKCKERREKLLYGIEKEEDIKIKEKRPACFACKYYNHSLRIIKEKMMQTAGHDYPKSKALFFIKKLNEKETFLSLKGNDILTLATSLEGLGNTLFSCSHTDDEITEPFLDYFTELIKRDKGKTECTSKTLSFLEKVILYYWAAASYFKYSGYMKEAFLCYKKILHILVAYLEINPKSKFNSIHIEAIKVHLLGRAIENLFTQYENTNMIEIQKIKWMFTKEMYETIPLNELSLFPDLEEIVLLYCELELLNGETGTTATLYQSMLLSSYRIESTIAERIASLRFKAKVNMKILYKLLGCEESIIYKQTFPEDFYLCYKNYIDDNIDIEKQLGDDYVKFFPNIVNDIKTKVDLIEFLIIDTMFALSKIIETISPTIKTTLFSESYMGSIYVQLFECNQIYEFIYIMYKWCDLTDHDKLEEFLNNNNKNSSEEVLILNEEKELYDESKRNELKLNELKKLYTKLFRFSESRAKTAGAQPNNKIIIERDILNSFICIKTKIKKIISNEPGKYSNKFFDELRKYINIADIHNNITSYHLDMALRKYKRAIEMHHEGGAYQELIANMYFLEDNLSNNTYQFDFAIERYYNNCGLLNRKLKDLKKIRNASSLFDVKSYVENHINIPDEIYVSKS